MKDFTGAYLIMDGSLETYAVNEDVLWDIINDHAETWEVPTREVWETLEIKEVCKQEGDILTDCSGREWQVDNCGLCTKVMSNEN